MAHREGIREYLKDVEVHGVVLDWGCGTKPIKNYLKPNNARFFGIDQLDHVGADYVCDMSSKETNLGLEFALPDDADFAFCLEAIEHVWDSRQLLKNIRLYLRSGGVLYLSQPYHYVTHKEDDRIRYTHHGLKQLLEEVGFTVEDIQPTVGNLENAEGFVLRARK